MLYILLFRWEYLSYVTILPFDSVPTLNRDYMLLLDDNDIFQYKYKELNGTFFHNIYPYIDKYNLNYYNKISSIVVRYGQNIDFLSIEKDEIIINTSLVLSSDLNYGIDSDREEIQISLHGVEKDVEKDVEINTVDCPIYDDGNVYIEISKQDSLVYIIIQIVLMFIYLIYSIDCKCKKRNINNHPLILFILLYCSISAVLLISFRIYTNILSILSIYLIILDKLNNKDHNLQKYSESHLSQYQPSEEGLTDRKMFNDIDLDKSTPMRKILETKDVEVQTSCEMVNENKNISSESNSYSQDFENSNKSKAFSYESSIVSKDNIGNLKAPHKLKRKVTLFNNDSSQVEIRTEIKYQHQETIKDNYIPKEEEKNDKVSEIAVEFNPIVEFKIKKQWSKWKSIKRFTYVYLLILSFVGNVIWYVIV